METVRVFVRFRAQEKGEMAPWRIYPTSVNLDSKPHDYAFDRVFTKDAIQSEVFDLTSKPIITSLYVLCSMDGYNATIFAYGQSVLITQGSGKTFTMLGPEEVTTALVNDLEVTPFDIQDKYGIIPRSIFLIFDLISDSVKEFTEFSIKCSYIEIYNEMINDLQSDGSGQNLRIREFPRLGMCVIGMTEKFVTTPEEVFECLAVGTKNRITCATEQNSRSSRSHTLFSITVEQKMLNGSAKTSKLNLIDLAGSEKVGKTGASGQALKEAQNINLSLTTLGRCIKALSSKKKDQHIPFRESKLTMILRESLGGNAKTTLLCTASAKLYHQEESLGTLKFAERAKQITVKAKSNLRQSPEELALIIDQLKQEVNILRQQLHDKDGIGIPEPLDSYNDLSIKYAEVKAQFDNLNEASQLEIERLRLRVEQLSAMEPPVGYIEQFQEQCDRLGEADSLISTLRNEGDILRRRYEDDVLSVKQKAENLEREVLMLRGENQQLSLELSEQRKESASREMEVLHLQGQLATAENSLKNMSATQSDSEHRLEVALAETTKLIRSKEELGNSASELKREIGILHETLVETQNQLSLAASQCETSRSKIQLQSVELESTKSSLLEANKTIFDLNAFISSTELLSRQREERHQETISALSLQIKDMETRYESVVSELKARKESRALSNPEPTARKKSKKTKIVISKLLAELMELKTAYNETQRKFTNDVYEVRQQNEEKLIRVEKR